MFRAVNQEEWDSIVAKNFFTTAQAINAGAALRSYADTLLKQIIEDLRQQYQTVNEAFRRRIEETKEAKAKLENLHYEVNLPKKGKTNKISVISVIFFL